MLMVPYTSISDTDGAFALAFADVGMGWARYLVSAGAHTVPVVMRLRCAHNNRAVAIDLDVHA